jgi:uncharacterized membrane protein (DUF106 family)
LTTSNPARKWYGCNNYKVIFCYILKLALCYILSLVDCDFFEWADKEMSAYEKRLAQHLKEMEEKRQADNDKVEELIEKKKCKEQLAQHIGKMLSVSLLVVILVLAFYFSSYSEPKHTNLMLK